MLSVVIQNVVVLSVVMQNVVMVSDVRLNIVALSVMVPFYGLKLKQMCDELCAWQRLSPDSKVKIC
jgi:hypothetical protein